MKELLNKYKTQILYLIFGFATTVVSITVFSVCYYLLLWSNIASNVISWVTAVSFAFITNKLWVFGNRELSFLAVLKEFASFVFCRILSGALEILIMYIAVDVFSLVAWHFKIIATVIVIICNYIASKIIFSVKRNGHREK